MSVIQDQPLPQQCVSIDVEEYFHIEAPHGYVSPSSWDNWPSRVEDNVEFLLTRFATFGHRGTFFILGHVAQRRPALVRRIAEAGHEIPSHGTNHDRLHRLAPDSFRQEVLSSKHLLEDLTGEAVLEYRAPTFNVVRQTSWAIDVLCECGLVYDASIFPVRHHWYGVPKALLEPFLFRNADGAALLEVRLWSGKSYRNKSGSPAVATFASYRSGACCAA